MAGVALSTAEADGSRVMIASNLVESCRDRMRPHFGGGGLATAFLGRREIIQFGQFPRANADDAVYHHALDVLVYWLLPV